MCCLSLALLLVWLVLDLLSCDEWREEGVEEEEDDDEDWEEGEDGGSWLWLLLEEGPMSRVLVGENSISGVGGSSYWRFRSRLVLYLGVKVCLLLSSSSSSSSRSSSSFSASSLAKLRSSPSTMIDPSSSTPTVLNSMGERDGVEGEEEEERFKR